MADDDFARMFRAMLEHPQCRGATFFPTTDGRWQVSVAIGSQTNWSINIDKNPLRALYLCMQRLT